MTSDYIVMPIRFAAKYQKEWQDGYDPFEDMKPKEVIMCRRLIVQRERADAALAKWEAREIDNTKE